MDKSNSPFKLMGLRPSPYTVKVESYFRYKGLPYEWVSRSFNREKLFQQHAKVQLIPLVFFPLGEAMQDSTLIIERLEREHPQPSIHPEDEALWFLSCLFEEFGDEWCNKLMFFQRWFYKADAKATGDRLATELLEGRWWRPLIKPITAKFLVRRMVPRLVYSGGNEVNIPQLKESFIELTALLDTHFSSRPYLLGAKPCFGDFGLWCNLYQAWTDPTAHAHLAASTPALVTYLKRMESPQAEGEYESLESLAPTLTPILEREVAARFLPWMQANHEAWHAGEKQTRLTMNGSLFEQKTFKYQANTLDELRRKFASVSDNSSLTALLDNTGCSSYLADAS